MHGVTIGSEANLASNETLETAQGRVSARFPCPPNTLGSLPGVHIACPFHSMTTVFFVPAVDTVAADETIETRAYRFGGAHRTD